MNLGEALGVVCSVGLAFLALKWISGAPGDRAVAPPISSSSAPSQFVTTVGTVVVE